MAPQLPAARRSRRGRGAGARRRSSPRPPRPDWAARARLPAAACGADRRPARRPAGSMTESGTSLLVTTRSSTTMPRTHTATARARTRPRLDDESRGWLAALRAKGAERELAVRELHDLLLRAARFEIARRRGSLPHLRGDDFDDLAHQSADDALVAILAKLDD